MTTLTLGESDLATMIQAYNDVTERLKQSHELLAAEVCRLREELNEKNKELERRERLAALGEMAAGLAHEIRNPLGAIGLYASLLVRDLADQSEQHRIAQRITVGVHNLESIIGDVLTFAGPAEPEKRRVRLGAIIEEAIAQTAPQAQALEARIDIDERLSDLEAHCDAGQVERVLLNLLFNALDAAGQGGRVWVGVGTVDPVEGLVCIVVEDDGPGVPSELAHRIFNPFFTTKSYGTGLGLAIAHRIAEGHGGRIVVRRGSHGGAAFRLFLPAANDTTEPDKPGGRD